jgi:hypothetical protein
MHGSEAATPRVTRYSATASVVEVEAHDDLALLGH